MAETKVIEISDSESDGESYTSDSNARVVKSEIVHTGSLLSTLRYLIVGGGGQ